AAMPFSRPTSFERLARNFESFRKPRTGFPILFHYASLNRNEGRHEGGNTMFTRLATATVVAMLCLAGTGVLQHAKAVSQADADKAAATVSGAFQDSYNANNPAGISALFAQGGIYLTPGGTMLTDPKDMEKAIAGRIQAGWTKETIRVIAAHPEGDDVWAIVEYAIAGTGANAGKQIGGYAGQLLTRQGSDWRLKLFAGNLKPVQDVTGMAAATAK
ncbi:MAG TPA: nuclear transport factor 2 family protein, partial [Acidisphaera sp.]|nr:nuclear transport factor 2 family protein [Acidisphaera sp.]